MAQLNIIQARHDLREAYSSAVYRLHETLFELPQAFALNQQWGARHPEDISALSDFSDATLAPYQQRPSRSAACLQHCLSWRS
jgi:hypothetical protein